MMKISAMEHVPDIAVIAVTEKGAVMAETITREFDAHLFLPEKLNVFSKDATNYTDLKSCFNHLFQQYKGIIAVMAQGIVTRMIAPCIQSKYTDPAVVTCDEVGRFAISTLSGHEGGANILAHQIASITGAHPVITTATEANRVYVLGIGCRKKISSSRVIDAINEACKLASINKEQIRLAASAWVKKEEPGLLKAMKELGMYIRFMPREAYLNPLFQFKKHEAPMKYFGIPGVAEPSALLAAVQPEITLSRTVFSGVTISIVKEKVIFND